MPAPTFVDAAAAAAARLQRIARHCCGPQRAGPIKARASSTPTASANAASATGAAAPPLKVYISVDIEGSVGIAHWDEADSGHSDYAEFRDRMTREAVAACEGVLDADPAAEIWVKDAHGSGRNILQEQLPRQAKLIRGWSGHPYAAALRASTFLRAWLSVFFSAYISL